MDGQGQQTFFLSLFCVHMALVYRKNRKSVNDKKSYSKYLRVRAPDVRVIVQMKEKILGLITNIHYEIQSDFHL